MYRLENIANQVTPSSAAPERLKRRPAPQHSDIIICCAVRTPVTKAKKGGLAGALPEDLLKPLFEAVIARTGLDPVEIQDVCIGNVLQPGAGVLSSRIAQLLAGLSESTPILSVNRQCASGLQAIANIAAQIHAGYIDVGLAGGVESMTHFEMMSMFDPEKISDRVFEDPKANGCLMLMGLTSENVAEQFGVSRVMQDEFAAESHAKAAAAQRNGFFDDEIVPVKVKNKTVSTDDGIRPNTNLNELSKLKPAFKKGGSTTAGNSSQVSDGAALCLLARRSAAERLGLPILARFVSFTAIGLNPTIMGIGPTLAIPTALRQAGLSMDDIDIFEINEAFASQFAYCAKYLKIPKHKLNPNGGAIALGHPLGATGCRQLATLLPELRRRHGHYGIISMCAATGMGAAAVIENLQV